MKIGCDLYRRPRPPVRSFRADATDQVGGSLSVVGLPGGQAQPYRETLPVDNGMDLGREPASGTTETAISIPFLAVAAGWWARMEELSIIWMSPSCATVIKARNATRLGGQ